MTTKTNTPASGDVSDTVHAREEEFLSDAQRLRLCEMAEAGASVRQIAEQLRVSKSSVSRYARRLGVSFDRSQTDAATAAKVSDGRARRAEIAVRLLEQAGMELDRLHRPHRAFAFLGGPAAGYYEEILPQPDPASRLAIVRTVTTLVAQHVRLAEFDGDDSTEQAKAWIVRLSEDLSRAAAALPDEEADHVQA
jgi:hypothetical protein